ncbi:MAG: phosphatase PAP2 family protein [Chloroflexi bacterium]|nr:phosphatase PAP2 family protein [Chloroflexota bacterium]
MTQPLGEAQAQEKLVATPKGQVVVRRRLWQRILILTCLSSALGFFLFWLSPADRYLLALSLFRNRPLIILLLFFLLVTISLLWSFGQRLDEWVFMFFNLRGYHSRWLDTVMWIATQIGNMGFAMALAGLAYVLGNRSFALNLTLGVLSAWLIVETIKAITDRSRPFNLLREARVIGWQEPGLSFPSGHTTQTFFVMSLAINQFELSSIIATALYLIAALVGFTRIYVGAHYPRDVLAGAILGTVWSLLAMLVAPYF